MNGLEDNSGRTYGRDTSPTTSPRDQKLFHHFPQILTYGVILAPKMTIFTKNYFFDQIKAVNDIFDQFCP